MKRLLAFAALAAVLTLGCTRPQARFVVHAADAACEVVALSLSDGTARAICLAEQAISPLLTRILEARALGATTLEVEIVGVDGSVSTARVERLDVAERELLGARARFGARRP